MELARWAVSAIFEKWPIVIKPYFLLFEVRISCVFLIFLLRSIKAYLCPNMIIFDAVDFSKRRPEEVISFFWRSVYMTLIWNSKVCTTYYVFKQVLQFSLCLMHAILPCSLESIIDHMHMTSQKGAPACWGSNEALPRAPSPSMQPAGQPLHAMHTAGLARARALTERLSSNALWQHSTCAQRDKSWPPTWRRCDGDVTSMHKVY